MTDKSTAATLVKGMRVRLSGRAIEGRIHPRRSQSVGTAASVSVRPTETLVKVQWDDTRTPVWYAASFVETVDTEEPKAREFTDADAEEGWTPERQQALRDLWQAKATARQIAEYLRITRNAVLGKIWRLGLSRSKRPANPVRS